MRVSVASVRLVWLLTFFSTLIAPIASANAVDAIYPIAVACQAEGPIYIADLNLPGILKLEGNELSVHYQASKQFRSPLNRVRCLTLDHQQRVWAGCTAARNLFQVPSSGELTPISEELIEMPMSVVATEAGDFFVADLELRCIWKVRPGAKPEKFADVPPPRGIALDKSNRLWVVSQAGDQVIRLSPDGKNRESVVKGTPFTFPHQIAVNSNETAFVTDGYDRTVWKIDLAKDPVKYAQGQPLDNPVGIALRGDNLLVADPRAKSLIQVDSNGMMFKIPLTRNK
ncbi:MAG: hypothetical protein FJ295_14130 [Planctomycetes bacterium]|nr:hypothetical protein [Planctomycetota bacterium]